MCIHLLSLFFTVDLGLAGLLPDAPSQQESNQVLDCCRLSAGNAAADSAVENSTSEDEPLEDGAGEGGESEDVPDSPLGYDITWSEMLFQVQGSLEMGDRITFQDGSLYDEYPLEGHAGQLLLITLESTEFDAYLVLLNDSGDIIAHNDDATPSNMNSALTISLPENDSYIVVASGFKQSSRGHYVLTVWTADQIGQ